MKNQKSEVGREPRRRYSREEKQRHVQDQASSGLSAAAYCREKDLGYGSFLNWQRQAETIASSGFRSLELVASPARSESMAEIRFNSGQTLLIQPGCSEGLALALTRALL